MASQQQDPAYGDNLHPPHGEDKLLLIGKEQMGSMCCACVQAVRPSTLSYKNVTPLAARSLPAQPSAACALCWSQSLAVLLFWRFKPTVSPKHVLKKKIWVLVKVVLVQTRSVPAWVQWGRTIVAQILRTHQQSCVPRTIQTHAGYAVLVSSLQGLFRGK